MAAYTLIVTGSAIQILGDTGTLTTLTYPTGVTAIASTPARLALLNNRIVITGAVSEPVWLTPALTLARLSIPTPGNAPTLAAGAAGTYSGTRRARVSFLFKNLVTGVVYAEGPLGPISTALTVATKFIDLSNIPIPASNQSVTARRVYLTTDGGATYFGAFDIDDITTTTYSDATPDAALSLISAPDDLVAAPTDLDLVTEWKNRLWGKSAIDTLVGTTASSISRWPNSFVIGPGGTDTLGITGLLPRRDELAISRRHLMWKLVGSDEDSFALVKLIEGKGVLAPDTCKVIRDVGYFLSDDGVYTWGPDGVESITDETVRPWFTTDTYFNRSELDNAFAGYDPVRHQYLIFLAPIGTTSRTRWITYDILTKKWFGPHKSDLAISWTAATVAPDANNVLRLIVAGSDGFMYAFTPDTFTDGAATAVDLDVTTKAFSGNPPQPDLTHVWLQPSVLTKVDSGGTLTITPSIGNLNASAGTALSHDLTKERERLPRMGVGRLCTLRFRQSTNARGVELYGIELPYLTLGRR